MKKARFKQGDIVVYEGKERVVLQFPYELATRGIGVLLEPSAADKQRGLRGVAVSIKDLGTKSAIDTGGANGLADSLPAATPAPPEKKLRYTGDWPPPKVLKQYPNWEMAYDEEGMDGQDETTVRPEAEQSVITSDTAHTAGDAWLADGRTFPAIITVALWPPASCSFHDGKRWWAIQKIKGKWEPYTQDYLPESKREKQLDLKDKATFPLRIQTRLPHWRGKQWKIEIHPDGKEKACK
jgi:hypothetical protein